jgi:hypothetical protein
MAASVPGRTRYLDGGGVRPAIVEYATSSYLDVLGLPPSRGRWFGRSEERRGAPGVAVIGYQTWVRAFGADESVLGRVIRLEGTPVTIGVGPANRRGTVDIFSRS